MKHQRGVALILVLMIAGILGILTLQVGLTAREYVARSQLLADRAEATLRAQSREAAMQYTLLTTPWAPQASGDNPYAAAWNFRGQPFTVDGVTYRIQDVSGLMAVPFFGAQPLVALARSLGADAERAERLGHQLTQMQQSVSSLPRPGEAREAPPADSDAGARQSRAFGWPRYPLQSVAELRDLPDMDPALYAKLQPFVTLYPTQGFNPLTAPPELLAATFSASVLAGVLDLRGQGRLDAPALRTLTGITEDDATVLSPGPAFRIEFELEHAGVTVRRDSTIVLKPYAGDALAVWSRRGAGAGATS